MMIERESEGWGHRSAVIVTVIVAAAISCCVISPSAVGRTVPADSASIAGSWRWVRSFGGWGVDQSPEELECERTLTFMTGSTYVFVERSAHGEKQLCRGTVRFAGVGPRGMVGRDSVAYVRLEGWWLPFERGMQIWLRGPDTLAMYPGGRNFGVDDALQHWFVRVAVAGGHPVLRAKWNSPAAPLGSRSDTTGAGSPPGPGDSEFGYLDEAPVPVTQVRPLYPDSARSAGIQGTVLLHALIGPDGRVKDVKVIRGVTGLNVSAVTAMRQWVYKPALREHKPVAVWIEVPMHFPP